LTILYKADSEKISQILAEYPLEKIIYDLFVNYIIRDSQTSNSQYTHQNINSNEVWILINTVLLPNIKNKESLDELVIKILNNFILNSDLIYSKSRVIESLENLPYSYDKIISYAIRKLYPTQEEVELDNNVEEILINLSNKTQKEEMENINTKRLLMTVLILNNLKLNKDQDVSSSLDKINKIFNWLISNMNISLERDHVINQMDFSLLKLIVNYQYQFLGMTGLKDYLKLTK